tara:strand:+ start:5344 stop:5814 length:471 start_codon:yes stop_codon:yes gene_type:complete
MLEMLMVANSAFAVIKQTIENGRELSSAGAAIAKFVGAEEQLKQDLHKKKNSIWTNFLGKTDNDLEEFMALEQIKEKEEQLKQIMIYLGRPGLYQDFVHYRTEARKARRDARIKAEKQREKFKETFLKVILAILITAMLSGVVTVLAIIAKKKGII